MKKVITAAFTVVGAIVFLTGNWASAAGGPGETLFNQHCAACHPGGGNIINPDKTLHKKDLKANNVKTAEAIVRIMRNPGPGMTKFGENMISDKQAHAVADYIMKTFK